MVQLSIVDKHAYIEKHDVHCHFTSYLSCMNYFGRDMLVTLCSTTYTISTAIRKQWKQLKWNAHVCLSGLKLNEVLYLIKLNKVLYLIVSY